MNLTVISNDGKQFCVVDKDTGKYHCGWGTETEALAYIIGYTKSREDVEEMMSQLWKLERRAG